MLSSIIIYRYIHKNKKSGPSVRFIRYMGCYVQLRSTHSVYIYVHYDAVVRVYHHIGWDESNHKCNRIHFVIAAAVLSFDTIEKKFSLCLLYGMLAQSFVSGTALC